MQCMELGDSDTYVVVPINKNQQAYLVIPVLVSDIKGLMILKNVL